MAKENSLGVIVFATATGLGYQMKDFCAHMNPDRILLVDLSQHNQMPVDLDWYPNARYTTWPNEDDCRWLCETDVVFYAETPLNFRLHEIAAETGTVVLQQPNWEFLDYVRQPDLPKPTKLIPPTPWMVDRMNFGIPVEPLRVPVNRNRFPFRQIEQCKTFLHIIGRPGVHDRNGTLAFLDAAQKMGDRYEYRVFYQQPKDTRAKEFFQPVYDRLRSLDGLVETIVDHHDPTYMYRSGDVLVLPRRYGGLCLPAQEALSSGLPVIMTDISPNGTLLPEEWLCDATLKHKFHEHQDTRYAHVNVDVYEPDQKTLINTMERFTDHTYMQSANMVADHIAETISWTTLKPEYDRLCTSQQ